MCPCFERSANLYIALVGREHNDLCIGKFAPNRVDRIQAVNLRHLQIHQRNVWPMRTKLLDRLAAVRCFADQCQIGLSTDQYG